MVKDIPSGSVIVGNPARILNKNGADYVKQYLFPYKHNKKMKEINTEELKLIQLDVLQTIHNFCLENHIDYSLGCGTLLGAIRHKGYIPWDDDIDIYLLRSEYNKLINLFPQSKDNIRLESLERDSTWDRVYAKAYDERTIGSDDSKRKAIGVGIDVFPIDFVPHDYGEWIRYNKRRRLLKIAVDIKQMVFTKEQTLSKKVAILACKTALLPFSQKRLIGWLNKYAQKYNKTESDYVFESCQGLLLKNKFKASVFDDYLDMQFEDRKFKAIAGYDEYLRCAYGDYMQLPPENKRVSHHSFKAYWK